MGRPSKFTKPLADEICARLVKPESLRGICKDERMPSVAAVCRWLQSNQEFREQYARARDVQADVIADETFEIVDDGSNDWMEAETKDGKPFVKLNDEAIQRSKLRLDQRKWWLSKLAPKKYGDKISVDGIEPSTINLTVNASTLPAMQAGYKQLREAIASGRN